VKNNNPLTQIKRLLLPLVMFSLITNLAVLVSPIYMMQVLDRVVPSGNLNTLALLLLVALGTIATHAIVEFFRDISLSRTARWVETVGARAALRAHGDDRQNAIRNVGELAGAFKGGLAVTALNMPWIPVFLIALMLIHPMFLFLIAGIVGATWSVSKACEFLTADAQRQAAAISNSEITTLEDATDHVLVAGIRAILENLTRRFFSLQSQRHGFEEQATQAQTLKTAVSGFLRTSAQILSLTLGAFLVVRGELTAGGMIGASIITAKTIGTIEASLTSMANLRSSFEAYQNLGTQLGVQAHAPTELKDLSGHLSAQGLIYPRGGGAPPRMDRVSLDLLPGECLAIVGDSGSGKTTLLHALCGIDSAPIGSVFLDESEARTLGPETIAAHIGYLPQQARLVKGTLAENISCFEANPSDVKIIDAARTAGVHGLISALPQAYQTDMGTAPFLLSAGQKQRVALARSIYQKPKYLFLDEPNALLDAVGERQLCDTLAVLKSRGTTIVMVLHRSGIMGLADKVLMMDQGRVADFGPRAEVLGRMSSGKQRLKIPLNPASVQDLNDWIVAQFSRHSDREFCAKAAMVGTELFNAACLNGPSDEQRDGIFTFRFHKEHLCELVLREERQSAAAAKIPKIKSLIEHPEVSMLDLPSDEIALAVVAQMADALKVENIKDASLFSALLSSDKSQAAAQPVRTH
jgi:ABC-type protease/lipase transport system fused ATPase/permease subunit